MDWEREREWEGERVGFVLRLLYRDDAGTIVVEILLLLLSGIDGSRLA